MGIFSEAELKIPHKHYKQSAVCNHNTLLNYLFFFLNPDTELTELMIPQVIRVSR